MSSKIILVTGANRGIGFAIVQRLATAFPQNTYLLGVRKFSSGEEAISTLRAQGLTATFSPIEIDITSDTSIAFAASTVESKFGQLDILINNAAVAELIKPGVPGFRESCNRTLDANVTSFLQVTSAFLSLLHLSASPKVINISSARGSVYRQTHSELPPTASIPYSISKMAMNIAMLEMAKLEPKVLFQAASPGHCKTAFNGFRGTKDPLDGAEVVVRLVEDEEGRFSMGFWELEEGEMRSVPW
ncbi:hypothetical protein BDV96DRAFT_582268 [Lophiotrema nucula]|uniref:NAD(P)-binding protein n=1 Tax=Lophiotrema nucula TaxID=690887 RepID=A0A6A5YW98_9PLEO|nr:hypothetical protein BDV96DRAFT_582268 [Lophiotrema nucula]